MATWYKEGVYGELQPEAADGLRRVSGLFASKGEDLYITSIREGTHGADSYHPSGRAWDQRKGQRVSLKEMRQVLGAEFDFVDEANHWHVEYDPV